MKKILIVSTVSRQFYLFEQGNIEVLKSLGYEIHAAANFSDASERLDALNIIRHHFDIERSPFSLKNVKAYWQLKNLMKSENFDAVHCHSPMGGVLARLTARAVGNFPVIYTAHGFHFFKGAPLLNWLLYYPVERFLARYTDILITINKEDYNRAKKFNAKRKVYIPGIGIDTKKFNSFIVDRDKKLNELCVPKDAFVILSVGELNKNKNHKTIFKALRKLNNSNVYYLICGQGAMEMKLKKLANALGIIDRIKFLGYRNDVIELYNVADAFVFPSYREGLSASLIEAMASGLPCIVSNIRGNIDLIEKCKSGYLLNPDDIEGFAECILKIMGDSQLRESMGMVNKETVNKYDISLVKKEMKRIYVESIIY